MEVSIPKLGTTVVEPSPDGNWRFQVDDAGQLIRLDFNIDGQVLTQGVIGGVSGFLENLTYFKELAISEIKRELECGGEYTVQLYVDHHVEQLTPEELKTCLGVDDIGQISPATFVSKLMLVRIGLYPDQEDASAIFDYTIGDEFTDYVLAVTFNMKGLVAQIDMES